MGVRSTSRQAYDSILDTLGDRQRAVYNAIARMGIACNLDIAYELQVPINRITPRTNELVTAGIVEEAKRDLCRRTGRRVIYWKVKNVE